MREEQRKCLKCGGSPADDPNLKLFRFPRPGVTNIERCEAWAKFCFPDEEWNSLEFHRKLYRQHRMLCHKHFEKNCFLDYPMKKLRNAPLLNEENEGVQIKDESLLQIDSVDPDPSDAQHSLQDIINAIYNTSEITQAKATPNARITREVFHYFKCKKHLSKIWLFRKQINKIDNKEYLMKLTQLVRKLKKKLSPKLALLLQSQIKNFPIKKRIRKWTVEEKILALKLYNRSPTCYRLLGRLFCLPAHHSLQIVLSRMQLNDGINEKMLRKFAKTQIDSGYILLFDEMTIQKNIESYHDHNKRSRSDHVASHALIFMLAGISENVTQPIAFYLSSGPMEADRLAELIIKVINKCIKSGLSIDATVCDIAVVNLLALSILGATVDMPYINVGRHEVVTMFDPPQLLKCFRNLFLKYNVKTITNLKSKDYGTGVAKWSDIETFYQIDKNRSFIFAPALTPQHLRPNNNQKKKIELAINALSHKVAGGILATISTGHLPKEAETTAIDVVENIHKLIEALSIDSEYTQTKIKFKKSNPHLQHLKDMKIFFNSIEFVGCNWTPPSISGWVWTLNAIETLGSNIRKKHFIKTLGTHRLHLHPIKKLFSSIRSFCGFKKNLTSKQFVDGFKMAVLINLEQE